MTRPQQPLTPRQTTALALLARRGGTTAVDRNAWWPLLEPGDQVRGILGRLEARGLVEVVTIYFDNNNRPVRVYGMTARGAEALAALDVDLEGLVEEGEL